ncbi:MAG: chloride channel protein, partial [Clostridia bacterium]|nr:chloride channel protein [Clostridia bacterium]
MNKNRLTYIANIFFPCVLFSAVAGTLTAAAIFLFKLISSAIIELSGKIYSAVRLDLSLLPLLIIGAVVIGLMAGALQKKSPGCRGGGIPTAISALRGYVPLKKTRSIISVFLSSMLTYIAGIPLGTEGPSVQIGTLIGLGTSKVFGKKHPAWDRYIMTGGACAGFSVATGAPLSGLFFAFEEAHRRFSPMIFMMAAMTVAASSAVSELISRFFKIPTTLFSFEIKEILPIKYIWLSLIIGFICGVCALFFTKAYSSLRKIINV